MTSVAHRKGIARVIADMWAEAHPLSWRWYRHPEAGVARWQVHAIDALRPLHSLAYRFHVLRVLITTPPNGQVEAPWERRDLRFKAMLLLLLPWKKNPTYERTRHHDPVIGFDYAGTGHSWSCTVIEAPVGWRIDGLHLLTDGDTSW